MSSLDALVFFGASGDLAHKKIFPALHPSGLFSTAVAQLGGSACAKGGRIVAEKPFGRDLASAQALNRALLDVFPEAAVFRIDHFLGKEPVQNLLYFRFSNSLVEPMWNRNYDRRRADHDGRELWDRGARQLLRPDRRRPRRHRESSVAPGPVAHGWHVDEVGMAAEQS